MSAPPFLTFDFPDALPMAPTGRARNGRELRAATEPFNVDMVLWTGARFTIATIEAGFESDGVSRPSVLRAWLDPWGDEAKAAVLHDWLLELIRRRLIGLPKIIVDLLFLLALISTGSSFPRAAWMFLGVRTRPFRSAL